MKSLIYIFCFAFIFSSCKKEEKKHKVIYKVEVTGGHPAYSLSYSSLNNSTQTVGPTSEAKWLSPTVNDRLTGSSVFLTLQGGSGGSYKMYIYVDGYLEQEGRMDDPYGPKTISVELTD
jgi:hypothetical protein